MPPRKSESKNGSTDIGITSQAPKRKFRETHTSSPSNGNQQSMSSGKTSSTGFTAINGSASTPQEASRSFPGDKSVTNESSSQAFEAETEAEDDTSSPPSKRPHRDSSSSHSRREEALALAAQTQNAVVDFVAGASLATREPTNPKPDIKKIVFTSNGQRLTPSPQDESMGANKKKVKPTDTMIKAIQDEKQRGFAKNPPQALPSSASVSKIPQRRRPMKSKSSEELPEISSVGGKNGRLQKSGGSFTDDIDDSATPSSDGIGDNKRKRKTSPMSSTDPERTVRLVASRPRKQQLVSSGKPETRKQMSTATSKPASKQTTIDSMFTRNMGYQSSALPSSPISPATPIPPITRQAEASEPERRSGIKLILRPGKPDPPPQSQADDTESMIAANTNLGGGSLRSSKTSKAVNGSKPDRAVLTTHPPSGDAVPEAFRTPIMETPPSLPNTPRLETVPNTRGRSTRKTLSAAVIPADLNVTPGPSRSVSPRAGTRQSARITRNTLREPSPVESGRSSPLMNINKLTKKTSTPVPSRSSSPRNGQRSRRNPQPDNIPEVISKSVPKASTDDRKNRRGLYNLMTENGEFREPLPAIQQAPYKSWQPHEPQPAEWGMMGLGIRPPKERVEEVFNMSSGREPEQRSDMSTNTAYYNFWGTGGNDDAKAIKITQTAKKRHAHRSGKLDVDSNWIYPDSEGVVRIQKVERVIQKPAVVAPRIQGSRTSSRTPRHSIAPIPATPNEEIGFRLPGDPKHDALSIDGEDLEIPDDYSRAATPFSSNQDAFSPPELPTAVEEQTSPISEDVPETPSEVTSMQISSAEIEDASKSDNPQIACDQDVMQVDDTSEVSLVKAPVTEESARSPATTTTSSLNKATFLDIIRRARAYAVQEGNWELVELLDEAAASGDASVAKDLLGIVFGNGIADLTRLSPATVTGSKRTVEQREEDEKENVVAPTAELDPANRPNLPILVPRRPLEPFVVPKRGKRPDAHDRTKDDAFRTMLELQRIKESELNAQWVPEEYTSIRDEADDNCVFPPLPELEHRFATEEEGQETDFDIWVEKLITGKLRQQPNQVKESTKGNKRRKISQSDNEMEEDSGEDSDEEEVQNSKCTVCKEEGGALILCDGEGCKEEQHYGCAEPPLTPAEVEAMPHWYCRRCAVARSQPLNKSYSGIFGKLLGDLDRAQTKPFEPPKEIQERYKGVARGKHGHYAKAIETYDLGKGKHKDWRAFDHINVRNEMAFESKIRDVEGNLILCYFCNQTEIHREKGIMLGCDYCPVHWHIDCLPEPLPQPYHIERDEVHKITLLRKWKCPLHISNDAYFVRQTKGVQDVSRDANFPRPKDLSHPSVPPSPTLFTKEMKIGRFMRRIPDDGVVLSYVPAVNERKERLVLESQTWSIAELEAIVALREIRARPGAVETQPPVRVQSPSRLATTVVADFVERADDQTREMLGLPPAGVELDELAELKALAALQTAVEARMAGIQKRNT